MFIETISNGVSEINEEGFKTRYTVFADATGNIKTVTQGRKSIKEIYPQTEDAITAIVGKETYENPMNPLKWTTKGLRNFSDELKRQDIHVNHVTVGQIMEEMGGNLQGNRKMLQVRENHPDRDAQFKNINTACLLYMEGQQPVVSIDCKKRKCR